MKPATSNLACSWGLPGPIMKSHSKKSSCGPGLGELPEISAMAEASDFKFAVQLGFAKTHHENHTQRKSGRGFGIGKLPYIRGSPVIFLQWPHFCISVSGASYY